MINLSPLGKNTKYINTYKPDLLFLICRIEARRKIGLTGELPFGGVEIWNCYEVSWLSCSGKPEVALGEFIFPCESEYLIESKSFKLYLNSFNQTKFGSMQEVEEVLIKDLSAAIRSPVEVRLYRLKEANFLLDSMTEFHCIDHLNIETSVYDVAPDLLNLESEKRVHRRLCSHLLKSNCLATGQPDWGTVFIEYEGEAIDEASLLKYIISYRNHSGFHEDCVEQIYCDILARCKPFRLSVYARYTRRGGLDINPFRSNFERMPVNCRLVRQ